MFGIGMGPDSNEKNAFGNLNAASGFATNIGEHDLTDASTFLDAIISGDPTKISQALSPEISAAKGRADQQKKTMAEFGTRSGGTASGANAIDRSVSSDITNLTGGLLGRSASELGSIGGNALSQGMSGFGQAFGEAQTLHDQRLAQINDIFKSSAEVAGGVMGGIGNLDTTGGSTGWEQVKNFGSGFGSGID